MAKDRLTLYDKYGNKRDVDMSTEDVTLDNEGGKTLKQKLAEVDEGIGEQVKKVVFNGTTKNASNGTIDLGDQMQADWNESSTSYPTFIKNKPNVVTGIRIGSSGSTITPTGGVITLPESEGGGTTECDTAMSDTSDAPVQNKVIKAYVDGLIQGLRNVLNTITQDGATQGVIDTFNEVKAFLEGISSSDTLAAKLLLKQDKLSAGNGIVIAQDGKTVSVDAEVVQPVTADGTFAIRIGNNTYTINLNHSHPQYLTAQSLKAGSNVSLSVNQQTGEVTINSTGGGGGSGTQVQADWNQTDSTAVDFIKNKPNIPVVPTAVSAFTNDAGYLTQQSLAGRVQSNDVVTIVKISQAAYEALPVKDSTTLYLITES